MGVPCAECAVVVCSLEADGDIVLLESAGVTDALLPAVLSEAVLGGVAARGIVDWEEPAASSATGPGNTPVSAGSSFGSAGARTAARPLARALHEDRRRTIEDLAQEVVEYCDKTLD